MLMFIAGVLVGGAAGVVCMALCNAASSHNGDYDKWKR